MSNNELSCDIDSAWRSVILLYWTNYRWCRRQSTPHQSQMTSQYLGMAWFGYNLYLLMGPAKCSLSP